MKTEKECLVASLTLLVKANILEESVIVRAIKTGAFESLYGLLNEKYKELEARRMFNTQDAIEQILSDGEFIVKYISFAELIVEEGKKQGYDFMIEPFEQHEHRVFLSEI